MIFPRREEASNKDLILTIIEIQSHLQRYGKSHTNWHESLNEVIARLEQEPKEIYAKGYTDGQRALAEHIELCKEEQEPKTGHWILDETDNSITCDKCGCLIWANDIHNGEAYYCPNCGAKMESEGKK